LQNFLNTPRTGIKNKIRTHCLEYLKNWDETITRFGPIVYNTKNNGKKKALFGPNVYNTGNIRMKKQELELLYRIPEIFH